MQQPIRGLVATAMVIVLSLAFVALFDFPTFSGWVSYWLLCGIPMLLTIAVAWHSEAPTFAARRRQPVKGLLLVLVIVPVAIIVGLGYFAIVGGWVGPPTPMLMMCTIASVAIAFWASIMWGGWPFATLIKNRIASGLVMLASCYVVNVLLFRLFFNFEFMQGAPIYIAKLDPHGLYNAWHALSFYVAAVAVMFLLLNFELWPLTKIPAVMRQPVLGVVWTFIALVGGAAIYFVSATLFRNDPVVFMARGSIAFIFGSIIVFNMLQNSLFARFSQPAKGILNTLAALIIGIALSDLYVALAPIVTGRVIAGPPGYALEVWLASALLCVTFPLLAVYADLFEMWPLTSAPRTIDSAPRK